MTEKDFGTNYSKFAARKLTKSCRQKKHCKFSSALRPSRGDQTPYNSGPPPRPGVSAIKISIATVLQCKTPCFMTTQRRKTFAGRSPEPYIRK